MVFNKQKLKEKRESVKLSQWQLAELADVDARYISRLETGYTKKPFAAPIVRIARALGVTVEWFYLEGDDG